MLDGITIKYTLPNFEEWKRSVNISFGITVDTDTAEIKTKKRYEKIITTHRAKWETFDLIVKEVLNTTTGKTVFHLTIKGSLHKNQYAGKNFLPFTWQQLQLQVNHICKTLHLNPSQAQISSLEIGVNILTPFIVAPFLMQNIISYKGHSFNRYKSDGTGFCLGIYCSLTQYVIKVYDKGKQNDLPENLMRFEKRFLRMQVLNNDGIKCLADLLNKDKVFNLLPMLLEAWQNVLIYDIETGIIRTKPELKESAINLITTGQNPKYWERLKKENKRQFNYHRDKFKILVAKNGNNWQQLVKGLIQKEWQQLFKNCTNLQDGESAKLYNLTIKIKGKNEQKRFCQTCGKDITNQKGGSKFCGAKYVGYEAAHQCRNNSNNLKYKIEKIQCRGVLFDIIPFIVNNNKIQLHGI